MRVFIGDEVSFLEEDGYFAAFGFEILKISIRPFWLVVDSVVLFNEPEDISEEIFEFEELLDNKPQLSGVVKLEQHEKHSEVQTKVAILDDVLVLLSVTEFLWPGEQSR